MTSATLPRNAISLPRAAGASRRTLAQRGYELWRTLEQWQARARQRRQLLGLDERLLRDIGLSRADAERIGRRPFWVE